ncbi:MAG: thiamine diphosphokinase [Bacteroidales bacterium]
MSERIVILVDGDYPAHSYCRNMLKESKVLCCDGAAAKLINDGVKPYAIVGDMDSLSPNLQEEYKDIVYKVSEQETNDMTKAFTWALKNGFDDIVFMGISGKREDHFIANVALLCKYADENPTIRIEAHGSYGRFTALASGKYKLQVGKSKAISIFDFKAKAKLWSQGLEYQLNGLTLNNLNAGTLNKSILNEIELVVEGGNVLIYIPY